MTPSEDRAVSFERWAGEIRPEFEAFLRQTWAAMNAARVGHWIADTEEVLRQARDALGQKAFEKLLQLRIEAEEGAFSPSGGGGLAEQGPPGGHASDRRGARAGAAAGVVEKRGRAGDAGR